MPKIIFTFEINQYIFEQLFLIRFLKGIKLLF